MAITYSTAVKNARMQGVANTIDADGAAGKLQIYNTGYQNKLAEFTLNYPCGTVTNGVLTFSGFPKTDTAVDMDGTAALARIVDTSGDVVVNDITVGTSGSHVNLNTVNLTAGQQITINSFSITHG